MRGSDVEAAARAAASAALPDLTAAARAAIAVAETMLAELSAIPEVAEAVGSAACGPGCGWCCHQVVGITTAEEELLAEAVKALPPEALARLDARRRDSEKRLCGLPMDQWQGARIPCPLLEESSCVIHPARPLPCRAVLSADAGLCRRWLEGDEVKIPLIAVPRRIFSLAQAGLAQALAAAGIPPGPVALTEAVTMLMG